MVILIYHLLKLDLTTQRQTVTSNLTHLTFLLGKNVLKVHRKGLSFILKKLFIMNGKLILKSTT